jgi:tRNA(Met) cytidine acetyltransferase
MDEVEVATALLAEARQANERRLLVLAGSRDASYATAERVLSTVDVPQSETTLVSERGFLDCERVDPHRADKLLGTTRSAVVFDAHDGLRPNVLGRIVGAVDGGGLLVLLVPPLDTWPDYRDEFDETLAVPPFEVGDVTGRFRARLVETLRVHPGVAIVNVDAGTVEKDGLTDPLPDSSPQRAELPSGHAFPRAAYEACVTRDQVDAVYAFEALRESGHAVVVEADRGRGKSSAAGLAAASLAEDGADVLVTAPGYENAREVFVRAEALLDEMDRLASMDPRRRRMTTRRRGSVRYEKPAVAARLPGDPDVVIVDEAAALPVHLLERTLDADRVAYTTTVHGYEGAGRGFSVRFRDRLATSDHEVHPVTMAEPIRYAAGDPVETWAFHALALDARPAVEQLVEDATPQECEYRAFAPDDLLADENRLREVFGLLVLAHYRTEPDDLARLLDAPNLSVRVLTREGHVVSVALLAREGGLPEDLREHMYHGGRVRGNMLPDVLTSQLRDADAAVPEGVRIVRIATHHAVRSRGLGSQLLAEIRAEFDGEVDWVGTGFGATPDLLRFWGENGYGTVHLSTTRNDESGEHSALMLDPTSDAGRALHDRHATWFVERVGSMLTDALDDVDADVVRSALASADASATPALSERDWRVVVGASYGPGLFDVDPGPFRELALAHLVDPADPDALDDRQERLLVLRVLQGHDWSTVADELGFHSAGQCMRALGDAFEPLVDLYGDESAMAEKRRYE